MVLRYFVHAATADSNALEHRAVVASRDQLALEQVHLREEIDRSSTFEEIVGASEPVIGQNTVQL
jgi:hypothetical protein